MFKTKFLATFFIVLAVLFAQVGSVLAAPSAQDTTPIEGTIQSITVNPGFMGGEPFVVVTVLDDMGETQTVNLSIDAATDLGLLETDTSTGQVILDPETGLPTADSSMLEQPISIDPTLVIPDEEPFNLVAGLLADFFNTSNAEINQLHEEGFGFGLIAQALWMTTDEAGNGDAALAADILVAKQDKDFETFFENHPEYLEQVGDDVPSNWGQFKKALREKHENLGSIVSGQADDSLDATTTTQRGNGNGHGNGNGNGRGNNNGNGGGNGNGNGHGNND